MPGFKSSSRFVALIEVVAFVGIALTLKKVLDPFFWRYAGPVSLVSTLVLLTVYMRARGQSWSSLGLRSLPGRKAKLFLIPQVLLTFVAFSVAMALVIFGGQAIGLEFMAEKTDGFDDRWGAVRGNLPYYLMWLGIVWTVAAFGEEIFFRGFLITRLQTVFANFAFGSALSVILPALLFGYGHVYYQGLRGLVTVAAIGVAFGTMFLLFKRNLWPVIIAHGLIDTISFTVIFLNLDK